ncbi:hypothetical protein FSARC_6962 [Fusarium sarcochroum]|uniref:Zn(2)-C6 fungal-type domain-containing protein n=1 Tax=Fusarium sarcochroum TaxID=1208366 RepID=A0A8H4TWF7_9HYPO|nr:hypothetical protein FSARC_6962 [Fusarium sarcochroum]
MDAPTSFQQEPSNSNREDTFPGPEELSSNSNSPSSAVFTIDGRASPCGSTSAMTEGGRVSVNSVSAACLACRGKHLKCDGMSPCSRCITSNFECVYVASRRGYKGPRRSPSRKPNRRQGISPARASSRSGEGSASFASASSTSLGASAFLSPNMAEDISGSSMSAPFHDPALTASSNRDSDISFFRPYSSTDGSSTDMVNLFATQQQEPLPAPAPVRPLAERCVDYFYRHFHAAHPFVLPRDSLLSIAKETPIEPLLAVMRWIGSLYIPNCPHRGHFFQKAHNLVYGPNRSKDGFQVQALLLLLIGLDGQGQQDKAREILSGVERTAIEIGLNTRSFATIHGRGMPVMEESWRRTWWDLFVVDGLIAGVHRSTNFLLFDITSDVALPCEEYQYLSGDIPQPMTLEDMEDSGFSGMNHEFSSFAYRIQCAQNLGKLLRIPPVSGPDDENISHIETLLTNWRLHLPKLKRDALYNYGYLDEMMFQAHMIAHATSILLHQPISQLNSSSNQSADSNTLYQSVSSVDALNAHTKHTIQSAIEISKLITHRVSLLSHTHFLSCVVIMSSIVHLSKWAILFVSHDDDNLRQLIRLNIGALSRMSRVWRNAEREGHYVRSMAQEIYQVKKQRHLMPQFWLGVTHDEAMNRIAADDSIIQEFENMQGVSGMMG